MTAPVMNLVIESALRGLLFAAVVGAGLSLLRVRHIPTRKAAWTLVLVASLAMPFFVRSSLLAGWRGKLAWAVPLHISAPPASPVATPTVAALPTAAVATEEFGPETATAARMEPPVSDPATATILPDAPAITEAPTSAPAPTWRIAWPPLRSILIWLYLTMAAALLLRLLFGFAAALRLWMTAELVSPLIAPDGNVRASRRVTSPVTVGSGVVLPANYAQWERGRLQMVLAHEQSHVRQMDFWLQLLAGLYAAAFWFSPLGWWLRRKLAHLAEAMSDRAGMDAAESTSDYAQVLLEFAAMPQRRIPGVAMARPGNLSRRIDALLNESRFRSAFAESPRRALASLLLIPAALFGATVLIRVPAAAAQTAPPKPATAPAAPGPKAGPAQPGPTGAPSGSGPAQAGPQVVPLPPPPADPAEPIVPPESGDTAVPPVAPPQLAPPPPPGSIHEGEGEGVGTGQTSASSGSTFVTTHRRGSSPSDFAYHTLRNGDAWAVFSGTWSDASLPRSLSATRRAELERAHRTANGPFLWFTQDGKSYVVTDPAVVAQLVQRFLAIGDLGEQQRLLGQTQENLGKQMREMARLQKETAGAQIPNIEQLMPQLEKSLRDAEKQMQAGLGPRQMAALQTELQKELSPEKMAAIQAELKSAEADLTPERMAKIQAALKLDLSPEKMAEINAQLKAAEAQWNTEGIAKMQERLAQAQAQLGEAQAELNARQGEYGVRMGNLGEKMGALGEQQGRLGAEQGRLSRELNEQVQQAIQQALKNGKAHPVQ